MADGDVDPDFFDCRAAADLLTHDLQRVARTLGLDAAQLGRVLSVDVARLRLALSGRGRLDPSSPEGTRAVRLVRLNRALGDAFGCVDAVRRFLHEPDPDDREVPARILEEPDGIARVFARLDHTGTDEWRPRSPSR